MLNAVYMIEALLFGFGIALFYYGWPLIKRSNNNRPKSMLAFVSLCWLLVSWYPHDLAHVHNGFSMKGLVVIEYSFHLTVIIATLLILNYIYAAANSRK